MPSHEKGNRIFLLDSTWLPLHDYCHDFALRIKKEKSMSYYNLETMLVAQFRIVRLEFEIPPN